MLFLASFRLCEKYLTGIFNTEGTEVYTKVAEAPHFYNQLIYQKNSLRSLPLCAFARKNSSEAPLREIEKPRHVLEFNLCKQQIIAVHSRHNQRSRTNLFSKTRHKINFSIQVFQCWMTRYTTVRRNTLIIQQ